MLLIEKSKIRINSIALSKLLCLNLIVIILKWEHLNLEI